MSIKLKLKKLLRQIRGPMNQLETNIICSDNGDEILRELNKFNRREPCWVPPAKLAKECALKVHDIVVDIMICIATFATPATVACETKDCFIDDKVFLRDGDLDSLLTTSLPATEGGEMKVLKLVYNQMTSKQIAQSILNESSDDYALLRKKLIDAGKTFSPKQAEERVLAFENGKTPIVLQGNGCANLWFVHDDKRNVFVLNVHRLGLRWNVLVFKFNEPVRYDTGCWLFLRN